MPNQYLDENKDNLKSTRLNENIGILKECQQPLISVKMVHGVFG